MHEQNLVRYMTDGALKQCSRSQKRASGLVWRCNNWFAASDPCKTCPHHRRLSIAHNKTESARAYQDRYWKSEKGKANQHRANNTENARIRQKRYACTDKAKARNKRSNSKMMSRLSGSLYRMVRGTHENPTTFRRLGIFCTNEEATAHFVSTFEPWMSLDNRGKYALNDSYRTKWQIGHRIPRVWYDATDDTDLAKCWSRTNLYAQCARENVESVDRILMSKPEWLALKSIWPKRCAQLSDEESWEWATDSCAKMTRRHKSGTISV